MALLLRIFQTVAAIGLLMVIHEAGHYLAARAAKMRVVRFSIGFGPVLFKRQARSGTIFQLALIPFIAYVQIAGMNPFEDHDPEDTSLFDRKSVLARMAVIVAGPVANYLAACLLAFGVALAGVEVARPEVVVSEVMADGAAAAAGLREGDRIVSVAGTRITSTEQVIELTSARPGQPTAYALERGGRPLTLTITPKDVAGVGRIGTGIRHPVVVRPLPIGQAAWFALSKPAELSYAMLREIGRAVARGTMENFGGVVQMGREGVRQAEHGVRPFIAFIAALSVSLGLFNLLPFPALDGGRLVFLLVEVVFRRRVDPELEAKVNAVGMLSLLALMVIITYRDITQLMQ